MKNTKNIKETKESNKKLHWFEIFTSKAIKLTGSSGAFIAACSLIIVWIATGPLFHYSEIWRHALHIGTTIIIFLMVFLIQKNKNKDALAIQIKLNELVAASNNASNRIVSIEDLSEEELIRLNKYYTSLAELTKREENLNTSLSIEDTAIIDDEKESIHKEIDKLIK